MPKKRTRPKLERLEDRITPAIQFQGGPVIAHPELQALYLGADWAGAFGLGDQVVDLFDKLPPPISNVPTTYSEFDVADMVPAFENYLRTLATGPYMDMLTAAGYGVGQGSWAPGTFDPIDLYTAGEFPGQTPASQFFGTNGPDAAANFYAAQGYTSTWLDGSKAPTITDAQIQAEIENNIISGNLVAPDGSQEYVVFLQPGVLTSVGALAYHGSFIDPQFFGTTVIHYTVEPFLDYGNGMYNSGVSNASEYATGIVNPNFLFPLNTGSTSGMGTINPLSAANAGTALDHNMFDLGSQQIYIPTATPPSPNTYLGYDGMTFDMICYGVAHEVAEESTDPEVSVGNPSDPTFNTSNPAWADPITGNEICDSLPPTTGTDVFDAATGQFFYVAKICTQIPESNPAGSYAGENAMVVGPNDYSPASSGFMDNAGNNLLFDRMFDGHVMFKFQAGGAGAWITTDITALTRAPIAVSDVSAVNFNGQPNVFYKGADNHVVDLFADASGWHFQDIMQISGFGFNSQLLQGVPNSYYINFNAAMLTSPPSAVIYRGAIHVFAVDPYGDVEDVYGSPASWQWANVSLAPGYSYPVSGAAINSDPTTTDIFPSRIAATSDGTHLEVVYKDMFDNIQELEFTGSNWVWWNIAQQFFTTTSGFQFFSPLPKFHSGASPTVVDFNGSTYIFYRDVTNTVQEIVHNLNTGQWIHRSLTSLAILPPAGSDPNAYVAGNTLHVIFQTANTGFTGTYGLTGVIGGNIWDATTTNGLNWTRHNLTAGVVGNANFSIWGTPSVIVRGNTIDLFFTDPVEAFLYDNNQFGPLNFGPVGLAAATLDSILAEIQFTPGGAPLFGGFLDPVLNVP
ncbi:MAG TPA: hypothetical protein VKS79_22670 [Gemmataceae bacterium]|nr:hypothetical protein [Gemmataceae bacterium]